MHRLWLIFAQTVTAAVAVLFVIQAFQPKWLSTPPSLAVPAVTIPTQTGSAPLTSTYRTAAQNALPSVVHIFTSKAIKTPRNPLFDDPIFRHFFGDRQNNAPEQRAAGLGSGVVISAQGYILTNNHVIDNADQIEVALQDGRKFPARIIGSDPESDLAVLHIDSPSPPPAIVFADSDSTRVGDVVLAIGNPFGVGQTVTMGIVSAMGRSHLGINSFENYIQTDAAINPGNSGGALVDTEGRLVGINTAIYSRSGGSLGIGFAIPAASAHKIMEQIIKTGSVTRGWIGIEVQEITRELAESFQLPERGALIAGVARNSPAWAAGLRPGDVILSLDGKTVDMAQTLLETIARLAPGTRTRVQLTRNKQSLEFDVLIAKRPNSPLLQ